MEEIYLPLKLKTNVWTILWISVLFELCCGYLFYRFWLSIPYSQPFFLMFLLVLLFLYLLTFSVRHLRKTLLVIDEKGITFRLLPHEKSVEWREIRGIYLRNQQLYICKGQPSGPFQMEKNRGKMFDFYHPGHDLEVAFSISASAVKISLAELSMICEEVWEEKSGQPKESLWRNDPSPKQPNLKRRLATWQIALLWFLTFVGALTFTFGKDILKSHFSIASDKIYYVVNETTHNIEFGFETQEFRSEEDRAYLVQDASFNQQVNPSMSKYQFDEIERFSYEHLLTKEQNYVISKLERPTWWKITFDFKNFANKKKDLQAITLYKIRKPLFKDYFEAQMLLRQPKGNSAAIPVKIYQAH